MRSEKPRQIAARVLRLHAEGAGYLEDLLDHAQAAALSPPDRALAQELCFGVVRWQATLDWLIAQKTAGRPQKTPLQILLRLGLYQLFWLDRIPDHAAVNETVELAKEFGCGNQSGFINAVLRGCLREREATEQRLADLRTRHPALGHSHPDWLCDRWRNLWGDENLRRLMEWNNTPPPTYARLNTLRGTAEQLTAQWREEGVEFEPRQFDWTADGLVFELKSHPSLATLPSFQQGWFYIQDPSTLLAVRELDPQPGQAVLDLCAAPGGKTTYIAQLMNNQGTLMAQDTQIARRELIRENCARLGVTCAQLARPTTSLYAELSTPYDRILVDAPCTNTGVMRRRVDLRWRLRPEEIARMATAQVELLRDAATQLKPGGVLVYSTCSLEPEENQTVVQTLLAGQPALRLERERQLTPFADSVDGAYVARLTRTA